MTKIQHKILKMIWESGKSSRIEIGKFLNVNPSTVSRNLTSLISYKLVNVAGEVPSTSRGGRKAELLSFNDEWKKILGVSVEQGEVTSVLTNLRGEIRKKDYAFRDVNASNIVEIIEEEFSNYSQEDIGGICVATPGIVSSKQGKILFSSALGIRELELERKLEEKFNLKVLIVNNANAASASKFMVSNDLIYFIFSIPYDLKRPIGVGAGIMINGKIHEGYNSQAGEFWKSFSLTSKEGLTVKNIKERNTIEKLNLNGFVDYFSDFLEMAVNLIDPEMYVVGGDITLLPQWVGEKLIDEVYKKIPYRNSRKVKGLIDNGGTISIARGAALAFISTMMEKFSFAKEVLSSHFKVV